MEVLLLFIAGLTTDSLVTFNIKTCQIWLCWEWMGQSVFTVCVSKLEKRIEILQHFRKNPESLNITWLYNELQTKSLGPSYQSTIIIINYWWEASRFLGNFFLHIIRIFCFSELWNVTRYVMNNFIWQKPISPTETELVVKLWRWPPSIPPQIKRFNRNHPPPPPFYLPLLNKSTKPT